MQKNFQFSIEKNYFYSSFIVLFSEIVRYMYIFWKKNFVSKLVYVSILLTLLKLVLLIFVSILLTLLKLVLLITCKNGENTTIKL